jgi:phosphoglycolate phosphatase-like HAD superfamily hydrolase
VFVFDFDGVLADSSALCLDLLRRVQAERSGPPVPDDLWDRLDDISFPAMVAYLGIPEGERLVTLDQLLARITADAYRPELFRGIDGVLRALADAGPIAILSASPRVVIERALEQAGVAGAVQAIRDGSGPASKAAKLPGLLARFGVRPGQAVMIGDAVSDVRAGQANGMRTAAVTWGWQSHARLEAARPDWLLTRVDELLTLPGRLTEPACGR